MAWTTASRWPSSCPASCTISAAGRGRSCSSTPSGVWGLAGGGEESRIDEAIAKTEAFFRSLGVGTRLADYRIPLESAPLVAARLAERKMLLGEHQDIGRKEVEQILALRA